MIQNKVGCRPYHHSFNLVMLAFPLDQRVLLAVPLQRLIDLLYTV